MRGIVDVDVVDAKHVEAHGGKHAAQLAHAARVVAQPAAIKEQRHAGIAALHGAFGIVPAVDHAQAVKRLAGRLAANHLFFGIQRHQQAVRAIQHARLAAGHLVAVLGLGNTEALAHVLLQIQGDLRQVHAAFAGDVQFTPCHIVCAADGFSGITGQKRQPAAADIIRGVHIENASFLWLCVHYTMAHAALTRRICIPSRGNERLLSNHYCMRKETRI